MKTRDILPDLNLDQIIRILQRRNLLPEDEILIDESRKYEYIGLIVFDEKVIDHTRRYFNALSPHEKKLLMYIASEGGVVEENFLLAHYFNHSRTDFDDMVGNLQTWGLIYCDPYYEKNYQARLYGIPETYLVFVRIPIFLENKLGYFLGKFNPELLDALQRTIFKKLLPCQFKDYVLYRIKQEILDPDRITQILADLPLMKRQAVELVMSNKGLMWLNPLARKLGFDKSADVLLRNLVWNNPFLYIDQEKKKDFLIRIPTDIYYILKNKPLIRFFSYDNSLEAFLNQSLTLNGTPGLDNEKDWMVDFLYIYSLVQNNQMDEVLARGFSKKKERFIQHLEYKGTPCMVFWLLMGVFSNLFTASEETFKLNRTGTKKENWLPSLQKMMFDNWVKRFIFDENYDKKYLRFHKYQSKTDQDVFKLYPVKLEIIHALRALPVGRPIKIDDFFLYFFDFFKICMYYHTFNYETGLFYNFSLEQLELIRKILLGPLFWFGAVHIGSVEKLQFFFDRLAEQMRAKQTLNQIIKQELFPQSEAYFMLTDLGKQLLSESSSLREPKPSGIKTEYIASQNRLSIPVELMFLKWTHYLKIGHIVQAASSMIHLEIESHRLKSLDSASRKAIINECNQPQDLKRILLPG